MWTLFFLGLLAACVWSVIVITANSMSDAPSQGFAGLGTIVLAWLGVAVLLVAALVG